MAKRIGFNPLILLGDNPGDDNVIGGGTGQGALNPFPMSYSDWKTSGFQEGYDINHDGVFDHEEYGYWWEACNFTYEQWIACGNTAEQWAEYFGNPEP